MTCIVCGNKTEIAQRTGKTKKYCSKKCSNEFYKVRNNKKMRAQTDGPTPCLACGKMVERFLESNKPKKYCSKKCNSFFSTHKMTFKKFEEKHQRVLNNYFHFSEVCEQLGIHQATLRNRMKSLGFERFTFEGKAYVEKAQIESIKNEGIGAAKKIPEGWCYLKEAGELLQFITNNPTSIGLGIKDLEEKIGYTTNSKMENIEGKPRKIYEIKTLHKLLELKKEYYTKDCKNCGEKFYGYSNRVFCSSTCSDEYLVKEFEQRRKETEQRRKEFEQEWTTQDEVVSKLEKIVRIGNYKRPTLTTFAKSNEKYFSKVNNKFVTKRDSVEKLGKIILKDFVAYHKQLEKDAEIKKQERFVRREDNWQDWWIREERLISDFPGKIKKWEEKRKTSTHQYRDTKLKNYIRAVSKNLEYHQSRIHKGEVVEFQCKKCEEVFPFYEFRFDETVKTGRRGKCRQCDTINKISSEKAKAARQKNYRGRLRTGVGISVKAFVSKQNDSYAKDMSVPKVWKAIEEKCGYNIDDLVKHIESKFTNKMNWQNQKTPRKPGEFGWHLDHIVPHSSFSYDSLEHPDFAIAWSLSNLQPLQARMNLDKSNKKLIGSHRASFISGIKAALEGEETNTGIWKYLDYSNVEAKEKLESLFKGSMSWKNHGEFWEIDHHNPIAHLAYLSSDDANFSKVWDLNNLKPLSCSANASKSSIWNGERWIHNYGKA